VNLELHDQLSQRRRKTPYHLPLVNDLHEFSPSEEASGVIERLKAKMGCSRNLILTHLFYARTEQYLKLLIFVLDISSHINNRALPWD
jgi:hypothetical protein